MYERTTKTVEEACAAKAARVGYALKVEYPARDELFLDYDSEDALARGLELINIAEREDLISGHVATRSPSGRGWHVRCNLQNPLESLYHRIALQAALGSDPKRELLSLVRYQDGGEECALSVFFERA